MKHFAILLASTAIAVGASAASAAVVTISSITGTWESTVPTVSGEGTNEISWGTPISAGGDPSGYEFNAATTPFVAPNPFLLGAFTHHNFAINGASLDTADLVLQVMGDIDGTAFSLAPVFSFDHLETPNGANPCAAGGVSPCPDLVSITNAVDLSETVNVGGLDYTIIIDGFTDSLGGVLSNSFLTLEGQENTAFLQARFDEPVPVPLPASMVLLGGALAGLGAMRRRKTRG